MAVDLDPASRARVQHLVVEPLDCCSSALRVVAVACVLHGVIYAAPPPVRHHTLIHELSQRGLPGQQAYQGFLLNNGAFASRRAAAVVAIRAGQVEQVQHPAHGLFSEDLW